MDSHLLPAPAAAARIGVKRATLYAYVSRGLLTAFTLPGRRGSWFDPVQLDALIRTARKPEERRTDLRIASAITLIEHGRYWYRGRVPEALAAAHRYEAVTEFLWTGVVPERPPIWPVDERAVTRARRAQSVLPPTASLPDRLRAVVATLGASDALRFDLRPAGALATARRLMGATVAALAPRVVRAGSSRRDIATAVGASVSARALPPATVRALDTTLTMMADHELAASTLAVRVAASFRADPYAAVSAGLGAMAGTWHGAASRQVEEALDALRRRQPVEQVAAALLREAHVQPGFGHPLYPDGDPRVEVLLRLARAARATPEADALLRTARAQGVARPNVDFALATLCRALRLAPGAGEAIFTIGRLAGWLAHAMEEYAQATTFRQRAIYTGPRPSD
ncbi:MAG: citrate/2-methylcitrate synthase [Acidobacteriota bacterium]